MQKYILRPSSKNQVTIPKAVRRALGVEPKEPIAAIIDEHGTVTLEPVREYTVEELCGILPPLDRPTSDDFDVEIDEAMQEMADKIVRNMGGL